MSANYLLDMQDKCVRENVNWDYIDKTYGNFVPVEVAMKILNVNREYISMLEDSRDLNGWVNEVQTTSLRDLYNDGLCFCNECERLFPHRQIYFSAGGGKRADGTPYLKYTCKECYNKKKRMAYKGKPLSNDKETIVYYISNGTHVKIGITSRTAKERIKELKTGSTETFEVIKTEKFSNRAKATQRETELHKQYEDRHVCGEWYDILEEVS